MFILTPDELVLLTGKKQPGAQVRALAQMGVPHKVRPDGSPVVTTDCVNVYIGVKRPDETGKINLSAFKKAS